MLQIIGWIACLYLVVKGFELLATKERNAVATTGAVISFIGAVVFFFIIQAQFRTESASDDNAMLDNFEAAADNLEAMADAAVSQRLDEATVTPLEDLAVEPVVEPVTEPEPSASDITDAEAANYTGE